MLFQGFMNVLSAGGIGIPPADLRLQAAQQENGALRQERDRLEDADYVERIAREDLGLTRAGEIPYSPVKKNGK